MDKYYRVGYNLDHHPMARAALSGILPPASHPVMKIRKQNMPRFNDSLEMKIVIPNNVIHAYTDPSRYYHALSHIQYMLEKLQALTGYNIDPDMLNATMWAILYHDIVYEIPDPHKLNEERSAEQFNLEHPHHPDKASILQAILATKTHILDDTASEIDKIVVDLDLWALASRSMYRVNNILIQKEVKASDDEWRVGRAAWIEGFLKRKQIYYTTHGKLRETEARKILHADLEDLRPPVEI